LLLPRSENIDDKNTCNKVVDARVGAGVQVCSWTEQLSETCDAFNACRGKTKTQCAGACAFTVWDEAEPTVGSCEYKAEVRCRVAGIFVSFGFRRNPLLAAAPAPARDEPRARATPVTL